MTPKYGAWYRCGFALAATAALLATGCGGGGSADSGSSNKILRIGTTYYIDTLNPFVGIETQDSTAYGMVFPQLVQYGPGLKLVGTHPFDSFECLLMYDPNATTTWPGFVGLTAPEA